MCRSKMTVSVVFLLLASCGTMQNSATQGVHYQMTDQEVRALLGEPDRIVPIPELSSARGLVWVYWIDGEVCQIEFRLGKVAQRPACLGVERKKEIEAISIERDPGQRENDLREAKEKRRKEEELNRWRPKLREPE